MAAPLMKRKAGKMIDLTVWKNNYNQEQRKSNEITLQISKAVKDKHESELQGKNVYMDKPPKISLYQSEIKQLYDALGEILKVYPAVKDDYVPNSMKVEEPIQLSLPELPDDDDFNF